jgi:hypothetical protein
MGRLNAMTKHELKTRNDKVDSEEQPDHSNVSPAPRDPIEPDPLNPVEAPGDTESKSTERPDLDWAEHED